MLYAHLTETALPWSRDPVERRERGGVLVDQEPRCDGKRRSGARCPGDHGRVVVAMDRCERTELGANDVALHAFGRGQEGQPPSIGTVRRIHGVLYGALAQVLR